MKRSKLRSSGCAALIVLASMVASVQAGESMAASSASAPGATRKENRALRKLVYAAFARDKSIDAGDIGVGAKDGAMTLTGAVGNAAQIEKAAALAGGVAGVTSVTNKLTVKRSFGQ